MMTPRLLLVRRTALTFALIVVAFLIPVSSQTSDCVRVTLLQVNDVYQFLPVDRGARGGLARILTLKKKAQKENPNTLLLLAGDTIGPSVESTFTSATIKQPLLGAQMIDAWNAIGLDYATFGNHEFDFQREGKAAVLQERMKESKFTWIASNVIDKRIGKPFGGAQPYVIRSFDSVKIGIFGLTLPETKSTSSPGPDVDFQDNCQTAKAMVSELRNRGVKVIIALTHLSMREDKEVARCSGVNLIVGGHEHTLLESHAGVAPIFKMTADARELGQIDLNISKATGELQSIDWVVKTVGTDTEEAPEFASVAQKYAAMVKELAQHVGVTSEKLNAGSAENRTQETNVGNFVTDAFRQAMNADVALINGGSIRADELIEAGDLTLRNVLSILPFKNQLIKIEITGATLRAALEHGVGRSAEDAEPGRFPQVSGIHFSFDASREAGKRVVDVTVNGRPLDPAKKYTLATTTFTANGGDDYVMFKGARVVTPPGPIDSEVLRLAISAVPSIAPKVEGRIKRLDAVKKATASCK